MSMPQPISGFLFVGPAHMAPHAPGRRIDDNYFERVRDKLRQVMAHAKARQLQPVFLGPLATRHFDVRVLAVLLETFEETPPVCLARPQDLHQGELDPHSLLGILQAAGRARVADRAGVVHTYPVLHGTQTETVHLFAMPEGTAAPNSLGFDEGLPMGHTTVVAASVPYTPDAAVVPGLAPREIPGCKWFFNGLPLIPGEQMAGQTRYTDTGPLTRLYLRQESLSPTIIAWTPDAGIERIDISHERHVFEHHCAQVTEAAPADQDFVDMFAERSRETLEGETSLGDVLDEVRRRLDVSAPVWERVDILLEDATREQEAAIQSGA